MAHLHINGIQVKTRQGYDVSFDEVLPRRGYSPNGNYQFARNGLGRKWRFQTIPLPRDEAQALAAMLNMRGDHWRWDLSAAANGVEYVTDDSTSNVWSDKRRVPQAAEADCTIVSAYGADGSRVYDWNGNAYAPFSGCTGALLVEPGATNIATANMFDPANTTGFTPDSGGASVAHDTDHYWTGDGSVKVTTTGSSEGVLIGTVTGQTDYTLSCYVKVPQAFITAGGELGIRVYDNTAAAYIGSVKTLTPTVADAWYRVYANGSPAGGASSNVSLGIFTGTSDPATDFWVDGAHFESQPTDGYPTAPVDPGSDPWGSGNGVRDNGVLDFDTFVAGYTQGITLSAWVNMQYTGAAANRYLVKTSESNPRAFLLINTSDLPNAQVFASDGSQLNINGSALSVGWHHIVSVYDRTVDTLYLYVDGALAGSDAVWGGARKFFDVETMPAGDMNIGSNGNAGTQTCNGPLGPVSILPFAVPASFVTKWYNSATDDVPVPGLLPLAAHGDFLGAGEKSVKVYAQVNSLTNLPYQDSTVGWSSGAAVVDFTLYEATAQ